MHLKYVNFEELFDPEKVITSAQPLKQKKFDDDGVYSERIFGNNQDPSNIECLGWINFGDNYIINPCAFEKMKKVFKNAKLLKMINYNRRTDKDGNIIEIDDDLVDDNYIGLIEFRERFPELIEKYGNKEKSEYQQIVDMYNNDLLFIHVFPVFSAKLRPAMMLGETLVFDSINNEYNFMVSYSNELQEIVGDDSSDEVKLLKLPLMYQLQMYAYDIVQEIINNFLKGKKGAFRKLVVGARVNFSSRCVITPKTDGHMCDVSLPYKCFLELFKFPLINLISIAEDCTYNEANDFFNECTTHFDPKMYRYMNELIEKTNGGIQIILNRNPTISIGSMMLLTVSDVKEDFNDLTLSPSNNILTPLNADFDG